MYIYIYISISSWPESVKLVRVCQTSAMGKGGRVPRGPRPGPYYGPGRRYGSRRQLRVNMSEPSMAPFRSIEEVGNWDLQMPVQQDEARRGCDTVGPVMVYDSAFSGINMAADAMAMALRVLAKVGTQIRSTRNIGNAFVL